MALDRETLPEQEFMQVQFEEGRAVLAVILQAQATANGWLLVVWKSLEPPFKHLA
jgi:hypothetical protein